jgi:outer membrane protein OmpA-like peptidoglycan-associated protein
MKNINLCFLVFVVLLSSCKIKQSQKKQLSNGKKVTEYSDPTEKKMDIPIYTSENEYSTEPIQSLDEKSLTSDFSFVDDENLFIDGDEEAKKMASISVGNSSDKNLIMDFNSERASVDTFVNSENPAEDLDSYNRDMEESKYIFDSVKFDFDKNIIKDDQKKSVKQDIDEAKKAVKKGKDIIINGHTCQIGSPSYNLALSLRRANVVKQEMIKAGVDEKKIKTVGYGYESPIVWTDKTSRSEKIRELAVNRRAEITTG